LGLKILIYPVQVQGEAAPGMIVQALIDLAQYRPQPEVIVLTRGGGSLEDLWAFNDEKVARAVADCPIPVISAVGHEVDYTISDFVADVRASTPSAAAEILIRSKKEWQTEVEGIKTRLVKVLKLRLDRFRLETSHLEGRLADPRRNLNRWRLGLADLLDRLFRARAKKTEQEKRRYSWLIHRLVSASPRAGLVRIQDRRTTLTQDLVRGGRRCLDEARIRTAASVERLEALSPLATLSRGYSLTIGPEGRLVRSADQVTVGQKVSVRLHRGYLGCLVKEVKRQ
jgi:exodeoxyribonuclease VII large subunit